MEYYEKLYQDSLEQNEKLQGIIDNMKGIVERALQEPMGLGVVVAVHEADNLIRVRTEDGHSKFVTALDKEDLPVFKEDTSLLFSGNLAVKLLPEELTVKEKIPEFKHLAWSEIGGMKSQIQEIRDAVELPLKNPQIYREYGLSPLKGILLWGPPGTGKTLIARAIASTVLENLAQPDGDSFMYIKGPELLNKFVGQSEANVRQLFARGQKHYEKYGIRAVLFIDEAESLVPVRGSGVSSDMDKTLVPTFLAEMDSFTDSSPFIIMATNRPEFIDEAVLRDGRIDLKIHINRPNAEDAQDIFKIHLSKTKLDGHIDILAAEGTKLLMKDDNITTGAAIATIVKKAANSSIKRRLADSKVAGVSMEDLEYAILTN